MAARTKTKVSPKYKTKYRVKNWPAYDIALRNRGDITVWFDEEWQAHKHRTSSHRRSWPLTGVATSSQRHSPIEL